MKQFNSKYIWIITSFILFVGYWVSCTKKDQILNPTGTSDATTELVALKVSTGPTIDGTIDASWASAQKLTATVTVPDPGNDYFKGYVGSSHTVSIRSMYDANKIYFLAEWNDPSKSLNRDSWYFDPVTKRWEEENRKPTFDAAGNKTREAFYEDKFAMLWNVNNSMTEFNSKGCYASCHTSLDPLTHGGATGRHFTSSGTEFLDMWHGILVL